MVRQGEFLKVKAAMCTVVILRRPGHDWPLLLAGNRDEMKGRPWKPPARHWPDRPFAERHHPALAVTEDLHLDMPGFCYEALQIDACIAEAGARRALHGFERGL